MTLETEREKFEEVASDYGESPKSVERGRDGGYKLMQTQVGWMWWQARAALEAKQVEVKMPEYGIDTANHAGIRVRGYTEQQVRSLLAQHGINIAD